MARDRREAVQDKKGGRIIYKGLWTKEEDDNLRKLVAGMKELPSNKIWVSIGEAMKQRNGKQCRERWLNHLSPDIRKGVWSEVRHPTCHTIVGGNLGVACSWRNGRSRRPTRSWATSGLRSPNCCQAGPTTGAATCHCLPGELWACVTQAGCVLTAPGLCLVMQRQEPLELGAEAAGAAQQQNRGSQGQGQGCGPAITRLVVAWPTAAAAAAATAAQDVSEPSIRRIGVDEAGAG
jgi:hypothetical protein